MSIPLFLISSREGRLCVDGKRVPKPSTNICTPDQFASGALAIPATLENIKAVSQVFLDLFIIPQGIRFKWPAGRDRALDVVPKYNVPDSIKDDDALVRLFRGLFRSNRNLTRGWCCLASGTLHRFFYREFDLYKGGDEYGDPSDFHWWLHNEKRGTIDLTEEQYRVMRIYDLRTDGKKMSPMGYSYSVKTKNMATRVAEVLCDGFVDPALVKATGYKKD